MRPEIRASRPTTMVSFFAWIRFRTQPHVSRGEFYDIEGREVVALGSAYGAPNARNGLYECHISYKKCYTYIN